jgi:hypothetical protein
MNVEHLWNDTDCRKLKYLEKNMSQFDIVYHKFHMDGPGIEPGFPC